MNTYRYNASGVQKMKSTFSFMDSREFRIGLMLLAVSMLVLYVFQTSAFATRGYKINELEKALHALETEQKSMTVQIAEYTSMKSVEARLKESNLVPAGQVSFASPVANAVALR